MALTKSNVVDYLNRYCFDKIWNEMGAEYRINIALRCLSTRLVTGRFSTDQIALPTLTGQYAVYMTNTWRFCGGLTVAEEDVWYSTDVICNTQKAVIDVYPANGVVLPKIDTYIMKSGDRVFLAIAKAAIVKTIGLGNHKSLYLTIYRDSDIENDITCSSFHIGAYDTTTTVPARISTALQNAIDASADGTILIINGYECEPTGAYTWSPGDYVDILCDTNVVGKFAINLATTETGYFSTKNSVYRDVIHIPKALNPNERLITLNTVTMHVRKNATNRGVLFHYTDDDSVVQLTHNDMAVSTSDLTAHRGFLNTDDISLVIRIRTHNKDNVIIRDHNYIDYLYLCSDSVIVQHLRGKIDATLPFWTAAHLESSAYTALMADTPNVDDEDLLDTYIEAFGYYTTAAILCHHERLVTIDTKPFGNISVEKPYIFQNVNTFPIVRLDGRKIRHDYISYQDIGDYRLVIGLTDEVVYQKNQVVGINLLQAGDASPYLHKVTVTTRAVTVDFEKPKVYKVIDLADSPFKGYRKTATKAYLEIPELDGTVNFYEVDGGTQVVFGASLYGSDVLIQPSVYAKNYIFEMDAVIAEGKALTVALVNEASNDPTTALPLLGYSSLEVFINGRQGIAGIDYVAVPGTTADGAIAVNEIVLSNMEYFSDATGNVVEIIAHSSASVSKESGYLVNNIISLDSQINLWYSGLSECVVDGYLQSTITDNGTYLTLGTSYPNGVPYQINTTIPQEVVDILEDYDTDEDDDRLKAINVYFGNTIVIDHSTIYLIRSYRVHSPYLAAIIADVRDDVLTIAADSSESTFLGQFYNYAYLKKRDPVVTSSVSAVDLRFVDTLPTYLTIDTSVAKYTQLRKLKAIVMPEDTVTAGVSINA